MNNSQLNTPSQPVRIASIILVNFVIVAVIALLTTAVSPALGALDDPIDANRIPEVDDQKVVGFYPGPEFDPPLQANFGQPGQVVTHTAHLVNDATDGGSISAFSLSLEPGFMWPTTITPVQTGVLTLNESIPITVWVTIPADATIGDLDTLTVRATSNSFPNPTNTTTIATAHICEPNLAYKGQSLKTKLDLDDIYDFQGQAITHMLLNATTSDFDTLDLTISGYDPHTNTWVTLVDIDANFSTDGIIINDTSIPPTYTRLRVQLNDTENDDTIAYTYQFTVCRKQVVNLSPTTQAKTVKAGATAVYSQTLNNWLMTTDAFTLTVSDNLWPTTLYQNGIPLTQTAPITDLDSLDFSVHIDAPLTAVAGEMDTAVIHATAITSPTYTTQATLTTFIIDELAYISLPFNDQIIILDTTLNNIVQILNVNDENCISPEHIAMTPDRNNIYVSCTFSDNVIVIDTNTNNVIQTIPNIFDPQEITFNHDGTRAFVNGNFSSLIVIDTDTFSVTDLSLPNQASGSATHPFQDIIYVAAFDFLHVIDTNTLDIITSFQLFNNDVWDTAVSPDGQWLYAASRFSNPTIYRIATDTYDITAQLAYSNTLNQLETSHNGDHLYLVKRNGIQVVDAHNFNTLTTINAGTHMLDVASTCDGQALYANANSNNLIIVDTDTYATTDTILLPSNGSHTVICPQPMGTNLVAYPYIQNGQGALGETIYYETTLLNLTNTADSYTLTTNIPDWPTLLTTTLIGPLAPQQSTTFTTAVTIPTTANWYDTDSFVITATSVTSPALYAVINLTSQAFASPDIALTPTNLNVSLRINETTTRAMTISNGNAVTATYALHNNVETFAVVGAFSNIQFPLSTDLDLADYTFIDLGDNWTFDTIAPYDAVIVSECDICLTQTEADALHTFHAQGGPILFGMDDVDDLTPTIQNQLYDIFDITNAQDGDFFAGIANTNHPIGANIGPLTTLATENDHFEAAGATWIVRGTDGNDYVFATQTPVPAVIFGEQLDDWWYFGNQELLRNALHWVAAGTDFSDWLTLTPLSGTLPTNSNQQIIAAFDATNQQPGTYQSQLSVKTNDPQQQNIPVTITLHVTPTATMGQLTGVVFDAHTSAPLPATIVAPSIPFTTTTDPNTGVYSFWLEAGTYNLQVAAVGYLTHTIPITVVAQQLQTIPIPLTRNAPILAVTPHSLDVVQPVGNITTRTITITNQGPAPLTYNLVSIAGDFIPLPQPSRSPNTEGGPDTFGYTVGLTNSLATCYAYPSHTPNCRPTTVPWLNTVPLSGTLPAYSDAHIQIGFDATNLTPGQYNVLLGISHNDPAQPSPSTIPITLEVTDAVTAISLTPITATQVAHAGDTVPYTFTITNQSNHPDTFTLTASTNWPYTLSTTNSGLLAIGQSTTLTLTLFVPSNPAGPNTTTLTAQSTVNTTVTQSAQAITSLAHWQIYTPIFLK